MAKIVPANRKGGFVLVNDGFHYIRNRSIKTKIYWRCTHIGCRAFLDTNLFDVREEDPVIHGQFCVLKFVLFYYIYQ